MESQPAAEGRPPSRRGALAIQLTNSNSLDRSNEMTDPLATLPGAAPLRMSDDQPATVDLRRSYVMTGAGVQSTDADIAHGTPPLHATLPVRASAEELPTELPRSAQEPAAMAMAPATVPAGTPPAGASVGPLPADASHDAGPSAALLRACQLLEADTANFSRTDRALLRGAVAMFEDLAALARERLAEIEAPAAPAAAAPAKKAARKRSAKKSRR
jgi:hypothetical protein